MVSRAGALWGEVGRHGVNQNALYLAPINGAKCRSEVAMAQPKLQLQFAHSAVLRYGLAVVSVAIAVAIALILQHYEFHDVALPLFLFAATGERKEVNIIGSEHAEPIADSVDRR
jgi:hypothetical protein